MIRNAPAIGMVTLDRKVGAMMEQAVEYMRGLAGTGGDDCGMERRVAIGDMGVEGDGGFAALVRIDGAGCLCTPIEREVLPVRAGRGAVAEQRGKGQPMLRLDQPRQRRSVAILAQVPGREPAELTPSYQPTGLGHAGVAEIRRIGKNGGKDRAGIVVCPAGSQMREAAGKSRPAIHVGQQIGDPDGRQACVEGRQGVLCLVWSDRAQRRDAQPPLGDPHVFERIGGRFRLYLGDPTREQRLAFRQPGRCGISDGDRGGRPRASRKKSALE
ncbi:hypothetical protein NBRC3278_3231 [Acetobacter pasteurianus NBRC 3278]|uniref:Uncharacterized protein n=1 Tax=Acetobacter pasteurianus NBRC 3278 TaxID=1226660 RepID=A0A401X8U3_ACEPA|nr:hypothetical protein NBRC3277_3329 [Acetobacter pasteurianus NBRC 3277]GCD64138.1 hypothetical protein NBRC3278_3231 [Acetobacter pasteurianus NBRC 3278]